MTIWSEQELAVHEELADVLARQSGTVTLAQLLSHGWTEGRAATQVRAGRWLRAYDGVFVTHTGPLPTETRLWAAVLACGPGASLAFESAAEAEGILDGATTPIRVSVPWERHAAPLPGVQVMRRRRLDALRHPASLPPRTRADETVLDLVHEAAGPARVVDVVTKACQRRRTTASRLAAAAAGRRRLRWRELLQGLLAEVRDGVQSPLEVAYLRRVERAHGLPHASRQSSGSGRRGPL